MACPGASKVFLRCFMQTSCSLKIRLYGKMTGRSSINILIWFCRNLLIIKWLLSQMIIRRAKKSHLSFSVIDGQFSNLYYDSFLIAMENDESYRFAFEDENGWRKHLEEQGFVVIANWLSSEECQKYVQDFWTIIQVLADGTLDRSKPQTQILSKNYPPVLHGGMIQYVGHSRPQWELRKRAMPLFQKLWKCKDLKSSFDGFCFMNGTRKYKQNPINSFLHCDQSPTRNKIWSYQGVMTLTDSGPNQGGFVCVPRSHHYHHDYFKKKGMLDYKRDWYLLPDDDKSEYPFTECTKINSKAGDFILFDTRTFHCNTVPREKTLRVCTYICMLPADHVPQKMKIRREMAVKKRRVSHHHPGNGFMTFPALPRYLTNAKRFSELLKKVNDCEFDKLIKSLI